MKALRFETKDKYNKKGLGNIVLLGLVSFFADLSGEMVYPIIPVIISLSMFIFIRESKDKREVVAREYF